MTKPVTQRILYKHFIIEDDGILSAPINRKNYYNSKGKLLTEKNAVGSTIPRIKGELHICSWGYHAGRLAGYHGYADERELVRGARNGRWDSTRDAMYKVLLSEIDTESSHSEKWVGRCFKILKRIA
jgi:hypothetical protein